MNLYVLNRIGPDGETEFVAGFDEAAGFVVAAKDVDQARELVRERAGDEGPLVWDDSLQTECHLIGVAFEGQAAGILMRDFHSG